MNNGEKTSWEKYRLFVAFVVAIVAILTFGLVGAWKLQYRWISIIVVMTALLAYVGKVKTIREYLDEQGQKKKTTGRFDGIFIDPRNKISLSHFQIVLWTILALSAWATLVLHRTIPILDGQVTELRISVMDKLEGNEEEKVSSILPGILNDFLEKNGVEPLDDTKLISLYTLLTSEKKLPESNDLISNYGALNVSFPEELLLAMGISTVSLAGAAIIKSNKARTESGRSIELAKDEAKKAKSKLDEYNKQLNAIESEIQEINTKLQDTTISSSTREDLESELKLKNELYEAVNKSVTDAQQKVNDLENVDKDRAGSLHINEKVEQAQWSDLLSGEKVDDYQLPDIAKVQMFFFTIIIVFSYAALIWAQMSTNGAEVLSWILPSISLPAFSESLVVLLGLSHVGYLSVKNTG